jgi:hypothetical protein
MVHPTVKIRLQWADGWEVDFIGEGYQSQVGLLSSADVQEGGGSVWRNVIERAGR